MKDAFIVVRSFHNKNNPVLVMEQGDKGVVLATFSSEVTAEMFKKFVNGSICKHLDVDITELAKENTHD
jgi:hypothetical protein